MNYSRLDGELARPAAWRMPEASRLVRLGIWSVANAALVFAEHLAEMLAPLLLLAGAVWWIVPRALDAITLDGQAADILAIVRARVPHELYLGGAYYSAGVLITDALWLVAVVAVCRTLSTTLAVLLLESR